MNLKMAQQWMGFTISIDCGPMGVFQGVVTAVEAEPQSVTLSRVFHNGVPHTSPSIVIRACDIKDLTIIAAPQAQLEPVVELKKPIPTRPGKSEGLQNFHSQPAPPRALHLPLAESDNWKDGVPPSEHATPQTTHPTFFHRGMSGSHSQSSSDSQNSTSAVQWNTLQDALSDALKINNGSQSTASSHTNTQSSLQELFKMNTAQAVSQRASQLAVQGVSPKANEVKMKSPRGVSVDGFHTNSSHGGFKMTSALASPRAAQKVNGGHSSPPGGYHSNATMSSSIKGMQFHAAQAALPAVFQSNSTSETCATPTKATQASASRLFQMNTGQAMPHKSTRGSGSEASTQSSVAEAFFRAAAAQASPQRSSTRQVPGGQGLLQVHADGYASGSGEGNRTPNKRDRLRQRWQARDEDCFGSSANNGFDQEFDFEKNLALFDKRAVYEEMAIQRPDLVQPSGDHRKPQNYRHDQNVIVNNRRIPTIIVPNPGSSEYVTDDGLIIPTMRPELLRQLHQKAHDLGFSYDRQSELLARCATEMSLQLLGGAHRLNPHNSHQWPTVIIMVGPHRQGTAGIMCARQLECQGVSTVTLVVNEDAAPTVMKQELNLYKCGGGPIVSNTDQLPDTVDLVIMALAGHLPTDIANSFEYNKAASWASNKRASVLALDPPAVGTPGIITKFALAPTLPMTYSPQNGKIYLCNIGIPVVVFKEMGIRYRSPFGSKFVIPLHPNDE